MKQVSQERRLWLLRVTEKRTLRARTTKAKRKSRLRQQLQNHSHLENTGRLAQRTKVSGRVVLVVPECLDLFDRYDETIQFVQDLRVLALRERRPIKLDFEIAKCIAPAASLMLVAEVYRCMNINRGRVTGTYPNDVQLERILQDTGFFELLGVANRLPKEDASSALEYIKFQTGTRAVGTEAYNLEKALLGDTSTLDKKASEKLYRGITEAMTNVVQHAYVLSGGDHYPKLKDRWWMAGYLDKEKKELMVQFYDQGVGIPATLPLKYPKEIIHTALRKLGIIGPRDGEHILAAMEIGRTRTDLPNRGRGLNDLRAFVDQSGTGNLRILSRKGEYEYSANKSEVARNHKYSLGGTLIQWSVSLPSVTA